VKQKQVLVVCVILLVGLLWGLHGSHHVVRAQFGETGGGILTPNACPEGQYLDLTSDICRNLDKQYGFDVNRFAQTFSDEEHRLSECSVDALRRLLEEIHAQGGLVLLPACTFHVADTIHIPNNTILQGAGTEQTVFKAAEGYSSDILMMKKKQNVIVRDLTVDGSGSAGKGVFAWYADNILFERLEVRDLDRVGIRFRYTQRITIRYSASHGSRQYHGVGAKDCFDKTESQCADSAGDLGPGVLWSQNYAIYSNRFYNNGSHGLDSHASHGEVAGNLIYDNTYGTKFPDASYVWIHHNRIDNNAGWGSKISPTLEIPERYPHNVVFYENAFHNNDSYPIRVREPVKNLYLFMNEYAGNDPNALRVDNVPVYTCAGAQESTMRVDGTPLRLAEPAQCDLSQIAHLFGQDADVDAPGGTLPEIPPTVSPLPTPTAPAAGTPPQATPAKPEPTPTASSTPETPGAPSSATATPTPPPSEPDENRDEDDVIQQLYFPLINRS